MKFNRRQQPRLVLDGLAFIQVEGDEGGRVLNVSENGLCFRAFSTVRQTDQIRFWFSFNLRDRIEAVGRLAWLDATKKIGGLALTGQSHLAREQIRSWVRGLSAEENRTGQDESTTQSAFRDSRAFGTEPNLILEPEHRALSSVVWPSSETVGAANSVSPAQASGESLNSKGLVPLERHISVARSRFVYGVVLGVLASSAVAIPVLRYTNGQQRSFQGKSQSTSLEISNATATSEPAGSNSGTTSPSPTLSAKAKPQTSIPLSNSPDNPFESAAVVRRVHSVASHPEADGALSMGSPKVSETKHTRNLATPQQLWSSVQAGNSKAAVTLADLYIRGDGVPVNCDQARVLLLVASEKNNREAINKLRDLDKTGCPTP